MLSKFGNPVALSNVWIKGVIEEQASILDREAPLLFDSWIPSVEASPDDIFLTRSQRVIVSDIIALGQAAATHQRKDDYVARQYGDIPKIKHGVEFDEGKLELLKRIQNGGGNVKDKARFEDYVVDTIKSNLMGVRDRRELIHASMLMNATNYDRYGIVISGATWGIPALYSPATPATPWNNVNATPISDIFAQRDAVITDGGLLPDTIVLTRQTEQYIYQTTDFKNRLPAYADNSLLPYTALPTFDVSYLRSKFEMMTRMKMIVIDDPGIPLGAQMPWKIQTYIENADGSTSTLRFWAQNRILLMSSTSKQNASQWDWANCELLETDPMFSNLLLDEEGFDGTESGPVGYCTYANLTANPPGVVAWAAQRGWDRLHLKKNFTTWAVY